MKGRLKYGLLCAMAIAVATGVVGGCGASDSTESSKVPTAPNAEKKTKLILPHPIKAAPGEKDCDHGIARVTSKSRVIEVSTRCFAPPTEGGVNIVIGQYQLDRPLVTPNIMDVSGLLHVVGERGSRPGRCRLVGGKAECHADFGGHAQLLVNVTVDPGTRCSRGISVVAIREAPCPQGECLGADLYDGLFRGRPRGC